MKRAIVTGANGFIGSWLVHELVAHGVEVWAVVRGHGSKIAGIKDLPGIHVIQCDLTDILELEKSISIREFDVFIHLAWDGVSGKKRADYERQLRNVQAGLNCAVAAKKLGCKRLLCAGTLTEEIAKGILQSNVKAENLIYGISKYTLHSMMDVLCKSIALDYIWMQFTNIYGPNDTSGNIVSYTLDQLKRGNIPSFSSGEQPYDLMYVEDLARAIHLVAQKGISNQSYFLGSGAPRKLKEYLLQIQEIYGGNCKISLGSRPEDGLRYDMEWFQTDKLENDTGFRAAYSFEQGIMKTIKWMNG